MAFKLTYLQISDPRFQAAIQAVWDCPMLDAPTSWTASRIKKAIDGCEQATKDIRISLMNEFAVKGADGKLVTDENGNITFDPPERAKEFEMEFVRRFSAAELVVKAHRLDFQALAQVRGITPRHWEFLEPIVDNLPVEEVADAIEKEEAPKYDGPALVTN